MADRKPLWRLTESSANADRWNLDNQVCPMIPDGGVHGLRVRRFWSRDGGGGDRYAAADLGKRLGRSTRRRLKVLVELAIKERSGP